MADNKQMFKWVMIAGLVLILFSMKNTVPAQSVAAIDNQQCAKDADCPCWGKYNYTTSLPEANATAYGVGIAHCEIPSGETTGTCDMTYCMDVQEVGTWLRDKPWAYLRDNPLLTIGVIAVGLGLIFWPKV
jgi:hypothetical protein